MSLYLAPKSPNRLVTAVPVDGRGHSKCVFNLPLVNAGLYAMMLSLGLFVRLSTVKFVKSFVAWQHLAASGGGAYRIESHMCL